MRLCIVTHNIIKGDGQGRANYEVVLEAIRCGHKITLIANNVSPDLQQNSHINWVYISATSLPTSLLGNLVFTWKSAEWLRSHRQEFDVVMTCGAVTSAASDVNAVHFVHSAWLKSSAHTSRLRKDLYGSYQWLFTALNANWEKKAFRQAKIVVAVSERVKQELISIGVPSERIRVVINGVDIDEFSPQSGDRRESGLKEGVTLALFVGDIRTPRKNLDTVLHALVKVPELHLAVVGATERSPYPKLAKNLGVGERVHFLGFRRDVPQIMKAADLFVFPSRYEACTLVLLEAMATGLPVITAVTTGGAEIVTPECGILLSSSEDVAALADGLNHLASDLHLREKMGKAARAIAEQHSWKSKAKKYVDLFEEVNLVKS